MAQDYTAKGRKGHLFLIDNISHGDEDVAKIITEYTNMVHVNKRSRMWQRAMIWIENILFGLGRHYIDDIFLSRISQNSNDGTLSIADDITRDVPKPTNDLLGRYIETNIALLTENRPIPRITPKSDSLVDKRAAELSELTMEYLWEELDLPEKHREIARLLLYTGTCFLETVYDPLQARYMPVPATTTEARTPIAPGVYAPVPREVLQIDPETGTFKQTGKMEYGDVTSTVISGFEIHLPNEHWWDGENMNWIMREYYTSIDAIKDKYLSKDLRGVVTKSNGYFKKNIEQVKPQNVRDLPMWWWERLTDAVEGPGPSLYVGTPETWDDYTSVRIFDRKPNDKWPKGRTVIVAGDQLIYDSPKEIGARAFDPRWPKRWHPYTRYRWEGQVGSILGRSLVSKLLPKIKRINSIDTTQIMWRRTVPIASWILPRGSSPVEQLHCLPGYAQIFTNEGFKEIRDLKPGDQVSYPGGFTTVKQLHKNGKNNRFVQIHAYKHSQIKTTEDHIFPIIRDNSIIEVKASEIYKGDYVVCSSNRQKNLIPEIDLIVLPSAEEIRDKEGIRTRIVDHPGRGMPSSIPRSARFKLDEDLLWLFGLYAAEGCTSKNRTLICLGYHELKMANKVSDLIEKKFGISPKINQNIEKGVTVVTINSGILSRMFRYFIPGTAKTKKISPEIYNTNTSLLPLVAGWLDGDGSRTNFKGAINFGGTTASLNLASQIRTICLNEGLLTGLHRTERSLEGGIGTYWLIYLANDCQNLTNFSFRFAGQVGPNPRSNKYFYQVDENKWLFQVTQTPKFIVNLASEDVYDITTESGYYNFRGITIHNSGRPGSYILFDPRRTQGMEPKPVYPPSYPASAMQEREMQIQEMEMIAGTEDVLRGERPVGVNSSVMLNTLRKQALASRSAILQAWDESLQNTGTALIQEVIKHIGKDDRYKQRINILAREKASSFSIDEFAAMNLSDNVQVRIDTASLAMVSREAKQARAIEVMQYAQGLMMLPTPLRAKMIDELGWPDTLSPQGPDIMRARALIQYVKSKRFDLAFPMPEDDPYVIHELLVAEVKNENFIDLENEVQKKLFELIEMYRNEIEKIETARMQFQQMLATPPEGGEA